MAHSQESADSVTAWLRQNAIPLRHLEPGHDFDDLQPLKETWRDARVIGLGESTHGTREFFKVKHRLLEFLVSEMGFTVFALEASHTACEPINAWVQGGEDDLHKLLSSIHYLAWHTEEFASLVEWMRDWNATAPEGRKVTFLGADVTYNERGRAEVLGYLRRVAPGKVPEAVRIFDVLASGEARWPLQIDEATGTAVQGVLPALDRLAAWMDDNRGELASQSSARGLDRIRFVLQIMPQWWVGGPTGRTDYIGQNLVHLLDRDHAGERAVFWAHNGHIDAGAYPGGEPKAGQRIRERFGDRYYACALEFGEGAYQYRPPAPDGTLGDLATDAVGAARVGTIPWHLERTEVGNAVFDFRTPNDPTVREWLDTPRPFHGIGWGHPTPPSIAGEYEDVTPGRSFDGVLFIDRSTPVRPTAAAVGHAARKELF